MTATQHVSTQLLVEQTKLLDSQKLKKLFSEMDQLYEAAADVFKDQGEPEFDIPNMKPEDIKNVIKQLTEKFSSENQQRQTIQNLTSDIMAQADITIRDMELSIYDDYKNCLSQSCKTNILSQDDL